MRFTTIASAAVLALSTVVLVQVGTAPEEQKTGNEAALPDNLVLLADNAQDNAAAPEPGAPSTALVNSAERPAAPPR